MIFNWSRGKNPKLFLNSRENPLVKSLGLNISNSWNIYLKNFDENSCLESQKINKHPLISITKDQSKTYEVDSSILIEFSNTPFSYQGCINFAEKFGHLNVEGNFDISDEYLENANAWLWELANIKNVFNLIDFKQNLNFKKFSQYLKIDNKTGLWVYENNNYNLDNLKFPIEIMPTANFEGGFKRDLIRLNENLNKENLPLLIDDILTIIFHNFYRERMKPVISQDRKFSSKVQPTSLIGYMWFELFKIVENENLIKKCYHCNKLFFVGLGNARVDKKYCSNSCIVNGTRIEAILKKYEKEFEKKGYTISKSSGNTFATFDYWLISKKNKLIGGLEIKQSEVSEKSQKWDHQCKLIQTKLSANNLELAFLINKDGKKYMFGRAPTSVGLIQEIPDISIFRDQLDIRAEYHLLKKEVRELEKKIANKEKDISMGELTKKVEELESKIANKRNKLSMEDLIESDEIKILGDDKKYKRA